MRFAYLPAAEAVLDGARRTPSSTTRSSRTRRGTSIRRSSSSRSCRSRRFRSTSSRCSSALGLLALLGLTLWSSRSGTCAAMRRRFCGCRRSAAFSSGMCRFRWRSRSPWSGDTGTRVATGDGPGALGLGKARSLADVRLDARHATVSRVWRCGRHRCRRHARRLGGDRLRRASAGYPDLVRRLSEIQAENSYSLVGMASTARPRRSGRQAPDARSSAAACSWRAFCAAR